MILLMYWMIETWLIDLVLGAASSLFRFMFAEISEKILDSEYIISFPDITVQVREYFILFFSEWSMNLCLTVLLFQRNKLGEKG